MINQLLDSRTPTLDTPNPFSFNLTDLDAPTRGKHKKHKNRKHHKKGKSANTKRTDHAYANLAFQYGFLAARYDMLERVVELSIAANRNQLNDQLLSGGLASLGEPRK